MPQLQASIPGDTGGVLMAVGGEVRYVKPPFWVSA